MLLVGQVICCYNQLKNVTWLHKVGNKMQAGFHFVLSLKLVAKIRDILEFISVSCNLPMVTA